ncbi:MAG: hypothetical protein HYV20_11465 [Gemmatimonadetes bacterium]|nr:hypothetical protein [Gemmatimonadota bacterium]
MIFYHRTTIGEAREIMRRGFRDQKWGFDVEGLASDRRLKVAGVWLTDHVPEEEDAPPGDAVLEVTLDPAPETLQVFEIPGVLADGELWVVPANVLNPVAKARILSVDPRTSWWFERGKLGGVEPEGE